MDDRLSSLAILSVENACAAVEIRMASFMLLPLQKVEKRIFKIWKNIIDVTTAAYKDRIFNSEWQLITWGHMTEISSFALITSFFFKRRYRTKYSLNVRGHFCTCM